MSTFETIEAKPYHVGRILRRLRTEHRVAMTGLSNNLHREFAQIFNTSSFRRAWLVDGELMAVGGVTGTLLSGEGYIWLAMADQAKHYPVAIIKEARHQLALLMATRQEVSTTILCNDKTAQRFARFLGFKTSRIPGAEANAVPIGGNQLAEILKYRRAREAS